MAPDGYYSRGLGVRAIFKSQGGGLLQLASLAHLSPSRVDLVPVEAPLIVGGPAQTVAVYRRKAVHVLDREEVAQRRPPGQVRRVLGYLAAVCAAAAAAAAGSRAGGVSVGVITQNCPLCRSGLRAGLAWEDTKQQWLSQQVQGETTSPNSSIAGIETEDR